MAVQADLVVVAIEEAADAVADEAAVQADLVAVAALAAHDHSNSAKNIKQPVPTVDKNVQFHSSQQKANQSIVEIVIPNGKALDFSFFILFCFLVFSFSDH